MAILFSILIFICALSATEAMLHFTPFKSKLKQIILPPFYLKNDPQAGFDLSENFPATPHRIADGFTYRTWTNSIGCFDKSYHSQENYILLIGDSFVWGYLNFENKFGTLLEKKLKQRVVQAGVIGYGTKQEYFKLKKILRLTQKKPALVVLGYCLANDFIDDFLFPRQVIIEGYPIQSVRFTRGGEWKKETISLPVLNTELNRWRKNELAYKNSMRGRAINWLRENIIIYCLTEKLFLKLKNLVFPLEPAADEQFATFEEIQSLGYLPTNAWQEHLESLSKIQALCLQNNIPLLIVLIPSQEQIYTPSAVKLSETISTTLEIYLQNRGINYLNLKPEFQNFIRKHQGRIFCAQPLLYWQNDRHWNKNGQEIAATLTVDYILKNKLLSN